VCEALQMCAPGDDLSKTPETFGNICTYNPIICYKNPSVFESYIVRFGYPRKF